MATILSTTKLVDSTHRTLIKIVGTGGGDANTLLIDAAALSNSLNVNNKIMGVATDRKRTYRTTVKRIWGQGQIATNKIITLQWADDTNSPIVTFGTGHFDYNFDREGMSGAIHMLPNANATGNVLITSTAGTNDAWKIGRAHV